LLADISITSPAPLMKTQVYQKQLFFCLKAICTSLRKVPDHGRPFCSRGCNSDLSDHSAVSFQASAEH